jgi:hypothetical protein
MQEMKDRITNDVVDTNHYLKIAQQTSSNYFNEFLTAAQILKSIMTPKEFDFWCKEKMLLKKIPFQEKTFIQYACETSVVRYFAEHHNENFVIEAKVNPASDRDVDCRFTESEFTYNIEVKCANFEAKEKVEAKDAFKYGTIGRIPDREKTIAAISSAIDEGMKIKGEQTKPHLELKNMDNNLKDFLELAHEKFNPTPSETEVNSLVVCCDDARDIQNWHYYLFSHEGLFTKNPFADKTKYSNVDLVVFTNLYFKHRKFFDKKLKDSWSLDKTFNLIFSNPHRRLQKEKAMKHFIDFFRHYTFELGAYEVPGSAEKEVKDSLRITWFVKDHLEKGKGIYLFEEKPTP